MLSSATASAGGNKHAAPVQVAASMAGSTFRYSGTVDAFSQILRKEGFRAFYRGSIFAYAKVVPSIGVMYMLYELSSQAMAIGGLRRCVFWGRVVDFQLYWLSPFSWAAILCSTSLPCTFLSGM
jgi:predicted cobalt transporter CbtA